MTDEKKTTKHRNNIFILEHFITKSVNEDENEESFLTVAGSFKSTLEAEKFMREHFNTPEYDGRRFTIAAMIASVQISIEQKTSVKIKRTR